MTEGRRCQVHLLDDRKLELLVQVSLPSCPSPPFLLVILPRALCAAPWSELDVIYGSLRDSVKLSEGNLVSAG